MRATGQSKELNISKRWGQITSFWRLWRRCRFSLASFLLLLYCNGQNYWKLYKV